MNEPSKMILLPNGKTAIEWTRRENPSVNQWYLCKDSYTDYWKIMKDYHSPETKETYYKIVEYYNGNILFSGHTLALIREIMRDNTYRTVI